MSIVKASATTLESWRLYQTQDWMTTERFLTQLKGDEPPNEAMIVGSAFHQGMEDLGSNIALHAAEHGRYASTVLSESDNGHAMMYVGYGGEEFTFVFPDTEARVYAGDGFQHEIKRRILLEDDVLITGKADVVDTVSRTIIDYKTSKKIRDPEDYIDSLQWRTYLWIWGYGNFRYDCYHLLKDRKDPFLFGVVDSVQYSMHRTPELDQEVTRAAHDFAEFVRAEGLDELLAAKPHEIAEAQRK